MVGQVDALIDTLYLTYGSFVLMGVDPEEVFEIVHRANMSEFSQMEGALWSSNPQNSWSQMIGKKNMLQNFQPSKELDRQLKAYEKAYEKQKEAKKDN